MAVTLATFMEVLDTSIANVALPHIAGSLSAGRTRAPGCSRPTWFRTPSFCRLSGWFSSIVGRKRFYMGCVTLFTISSLLCGWRQSAAC